MACVPYKNLLHLNESFFCISYTSIDSKINEKWTINTKCQNLQAGIETVRNRIASPQAGLRL